MEAIVISGGLGTRLRPLTERRPKHVLPVAGVPFCLHQLTKLAAAGVDHVVLATSYRAEAFEPILGDGSTLGLEISYVTETEPLGTGGAIRNAASELSSGPDEPVLVLNGDQLSSHDLGAQLDAFERTSPEVVLHLRSVDDPRAFGCVPTDPGGQVLGFLEKSPRPVTDQVNAGCYVFRRGVIDLIPPDRVVSVERETFPELIASGSRLHGHLDQAYWRDVGTPELLVAASADLVQGIASSPAYVRPPADSLVEDGAVVSGATIGGGSAVAPGAVVEAGAVVTGSVLMAGAWVGPGARVVRSVLGPGARVGRHCHLDQSAVGDEAVLGDGQTLAPGTRVGCGERVG